MHQMADRKLTIFSRFAVVAKPEDEDEIIAATVMVRAMFPIFE